MPRITGLALVLFGALPCAAGAAAFKLASPELTPGGRFEARHVFNGSGCSGGNLSPALTWSGAPGEAIAFKEVFAGTRYAIEKCELYPSKAIVTIQ